MTTPDAERLSRAQARSRGIGWVITGLAVFATTATTLVMFRLTAMWPVSRLADLAAGASLGLTPVLLLVGLWQIATGRALDDEAPSRRVAFGVGFAAAVVVWAIAWAWYVYGAAIV